MRIHEIREIHDKQEDGSYKPSGRYRATVRSDEENWIHGECACSGEYDACPGHESEEAAWLAYRKGHLADIRYAKDEERQTKCQVCGEWSQNIAIPWNASSVQASFNLCDAHNNKEEIEKLYLNGLK